MVLKLYGHPVSTCTRKVLCTFAEKKVTDFEFVVIDLPKGQHKSPEHVARQPFGQIPVLEEVNEKGEVAFRLFESRAIIRYLDAILPGTRLTPADARKHALMEQWISVEASDITPKLMTIIKECLLKPLFTGQPTDNAVVEAALPPARKDLDVYEAQLGKTPYLTGDEFTLADLGNLPYFEYLMTTPGKAMVEERPNLAAWWKRCSERHSWQVATGKAK